MDAGVALLEGGRWFRVKPTGDPARPFDWFADEAAGLPPGSAVLNRLQFNPTADAWQAVSDVTTVYYALTRTGAGAELVEAIQYGLDNSGRGFPASGDATRTLAFSIVYGSSSGVFADTASTNRINNVWLDGAPAPFVWACAPGHTGWIEGYGFTYTREGTAIPNQPALPVARELRPHRRRALRRGLRAGRRRAPAGHRRRAVRQHPRELHHAAAAGAHGRADMSAARTAQR